jgi:hypothetical protein
LQNRRFKVGDMAIAVGAIGIFHFHKSSDDSALTEMIIFTESAQAKKLAHPGADAD